MSDAALLSLHGLVNSHLRAAAFIGALQVGLAPSR